MNDLAEIDGLGVDELRAMCRRIIENNAEEENPTALQLLLRVMNDVQSIGKEGEFKERSGKLVYRFRGVDAVMNAVGPSLRRHGLIPVPWVESVEHGEYTTTGNSRMRVSVVTTVYRIFGPGGDFVEARIAGEAADTGDKSVSKAESVGYRMLWLQLLCIPTDDPDPDLTNYEIAGDDTNGGGQKVSRDELVSTVASTSSELRDLLGAEENSWNSWIANICQQDFAIDVTRRDTQGNVLSVDFGKLRNNQLVRAHERLRQKLNQEKVARGEL